MRYFLVSLLLATSAVFAAGEERAAPKREVVISIDDLPRGGDGGPTDLAGIRAMTEKLLAPFREQKIPVIGFVNAGRTTLTPQELRGVLDLWLDAGADLGNHSFSHLDINTVSLTEYTADISRGEPAIRQVLGTLGMKLEYYRHPYLHTGPTPEIKKGLEDFLHTHGYRVAPVTLDDADYAYAYAYLRPEFQARVRQEYVPYMESIVEFFERRSVEVLGEEIPQILLIHASQMNADLMPDLLAMFRRRGYRFVRLAQALKHPAYQSPDTYAGKSGFSWLHRWSQTKGMPARREPEPPDWVMKAFAKRPAPPATRAAP